MIEKKWTFVWCFALAFWGIGFVPIAQAEDVIDVSGKDLQGQKVRLSDYRDQVVLLNFWATWCPPCRAEMPLLVKSYSEYASKGVVVVGASLDDKSTQKKIAGFAKKNQLDFPLWVVSVDYLTKLNMGQAIPGTAFIDRDGKIVFRILGQLRDGEVEERLNWLLGDRSGPAPEALVSHLDAGH